MNKLVGRATFLVLVLFLLPLGLHATEYCSAASATTPLGPSVGKWARWELPLVSTNNYLPNGNGNPQRDLILNVTYTQCGNLPSRIEYKTQGFWYGLGGPNDTLEDGHVFRIRGAFPPGTWQWQVTCTRRDNPNPATPDCSSDSKLNSQGRFIITSQGSGSLYTKGFLKVSADKRYLTFDNNERFFWLGDAVWNANILTSYEDWVTYVSDRATASFGANSQFTVAQLATAPETNGPNGSVTDSKGNPPFLPAGCRTPSKDCRWNAKYWKGVDDKIQYANSKGIVVFLAGFIEPIQKISSTEESESEVEEAVPTLKDEAKIFAQSVASRYYGNFVVFSPGFDHKIEAGTAGNRDIIDAVGDAIGGVQGVTTRHLVTNHSAGGTAPADYVNFLQSRPWLDFQLYQSGTPGSSEVEELKLLSERAGAAPPDGANNLAVKVWKALPTKPAINGEASYAGQALLKNWKANHTSYRARQTGYLSLLSGSAGFGMGTCGVLDWNKHDGFATCPGSPTVVGYNFWNDPAAVQTTTSMKIMRSVFQSVYWERLKPELQRIKSQPSGSHNQAALAYDGSSAVMAYVPGDNRDITIDFNTGSGYSGVPGLQNKPTWPNAGTSSWTYTWISPRTGRNATGSIPAPARAGTDGIFKLTKPTCDLGSLPTSCDANDWILKITKNGSIQPSSLAMSLSVLSGIGPVAGDSRILLETMDLASEEVVSQIEIGGSRQTSPGPPQVASEPSGNSLVVWRQEGEEEISIAGLVVNSQGVVVTPELVIANGHLASPGHPSVSAMASGDFLVAWSGTDEKGGGPWIHWATFDRFGNPRTSERIAVHCKPVSGDFPQVASLGSGGFALAWERSDGGIYVLVTDSLGYTSDMILDSKDKIAVLEELKDGGDAPVVSYGLYEADGGILGGTDSTKVVPQGSSCW